MGILYCDGERFRKAFLAGASWLIENKEILNRLNVFPVPDGDTGTNMSLTIFSAIEELRDMKDASLGEVLEAAARGTLMGARGCSGVIFSQLLAGFAEVAGDKEKFGSQDIAAGLHQGAERAYSAVTKPVEGTILTVIREAAEEAVQCARNNDDIVRVMQSALKRAQAALENTPNLLPRLAQAGVVDSGGQGFVFMLEGILRLVQSGDVSDALERKPVSQPLGMAQALVSESWDNPYCTEFILTETVEDVSNMRESFTQMGSDLAVVGWNDLVKVHIHTADPERVLAYAHSYGKPINVKIDDTRKQHSHIVPAALGTQEMQAERKISVIATAPGDGIKAIYISLGAEIVVVGSETRNPSISELSDAIDNAYSHKIILLPNDSNILPAAIQAASMSDKQVNIIPTRNISQGLASLIAFRTDIDISDNIDSMKMALDEVKHGEVARAVRNAQYDKLEVKEGDIIGLFDGSVQVAESDYAEAVTGLLKAILREDDEIITILYGSEIERSEAEGILEAVESEFPEQEAELHYGGQAYCSYILSVE